MNILPITPYVIVDGQSYSDETTILITPADFSEVDFIDGRMTLAFSNCVFGKLFIENHDDIDFDSISISFTACFIGQLEVEEITSKNISIYFIGSLLDGRVRSNNLNQFECNNCLLLRSLFITGPTKAQINFSKENIFPYRWKRLMDKMKVQDYTEVVTSKQSYYFIDVGNIDISSNHTSKQRFQDVNLNISIDDSNGCLKIAKVANVPLQSFSINGNSGSKILIENVNIQHWYMHDFTPKGEVSFFRIAPVTVKAESKIGMHGCNLDNVSFNNVQFDKYKIISLFHTKVVGAVFTACDFPEKYSTFEKFMPIENVHYPDNKTDSYHKDQYEVFLQFKLALEKTGNYFEAQKLQAIAHDALRQIKTIPSSDRWILWINSISNDHGLSIGRPFALFFLTTVVIYCAYLASLGRFLNSNAFDWKLIGYYFSFIDLTHRSEFLIEKNEFTTGSLILDYTGKVFAGFFIYQFIAAFRKYGKK